jgi:uncharacterized protein (TIGR04255 family)
MPMTEHALTLAEFTDPPLYEVVVGVQFKKLDTLTAAQIGKFWGHLQSQFPETQDNVPLAPVSERFDTHPRGVSLQLVQQPATPRVWFLDSTSSKIIQVQSDRFLFNWRRVSPESKYPRYNEILKEFLTHFDKFVMFSREQLNSDIIPELCELNYINRIHPGDEWQTHAQVENVFTTSLPSLTSRGVRFEEGRFNLVYRLPEQDGQQIGRLRISAEPRLELSSGSPIFVLEIGVRGYPWNKNPDCIKNFLDLAHSEIVPAFESVTTERMHRLWGKSDAKR